MTPTLQSASLHFREGNSDNSAGASRHILKPARRVHSGMADGGKVYHAAIEPKDEDYLVTFAYGRRGNTLTTGSKTTSPVSLTEATKVFDKLVASKIAKGYQVQEPDPAEEAARNLDWEAFLAVHSKRHRTAILVLVEGGTMREAGMGIRPADGARAACVSCGGCR